MIFLKEHTFNVNTNWINNIINNKDCNYKKYKIDILKNKISKIFQNNDNNIVHRPCPKMLNIEILNRIKKLNYYIYEKTCGIKLLTYIYYCKWYPLWYFTINNNKIYLNLDDSYKIERFFINKTKTKKKIKIIIDNKLSKYVFYKKINELKIFLYNKEITLNKITGTNIMIFIDEVYNYHIYKYIIKFPINNYKNNIYYKEILIDGLLTSYNNKNYYIINNIFYYNIDNKSIKTFEDFKITEKIKILTNNILDPYNNNNQNNVLLFKIITLYKFDNHLKLFNDIDSNYIYKGLYKTEGIYYIPEFYIYNSYSNYELFFWKFYKKNFCKFIFYKDNNYINKLFYLPYKNSTKLILLNNNYKNEPLFNIKINKYYIVNTMNIEYEWNIINIENTINCYKTTINFNNIINIICSNIQHIRKEDLLKNITNKKYNFLVQLRLNDIINICIENKCFIHCYYIIYSKDDILFYIKHGDKITATCFKLKDIEYKKYNKFNIIQKLTSSTKKIIRIIFNPYNKKWRIYDFNGNICYCTGNYMIRTLQYMEIIVNNYIYRYNKNKRKLDNCIDYNICKKRKLD